MKKIYLFLFLLAYGLGFGQINLFGDAYYKLNIIGYQDRDPNGCGGVDGLKHIKASYGDGTSSFLFEGRKIYQEINYEKIYTKNNPIVNLEFYKVVRWETTFGCNGGPNNNYDQVKITNKCFSSYQANAGSDLLHLTVTSIPYVKINNSSEPLYLGNSEKLKIELPDNIDSNNYNWKYKVGNGIEKDIPSDFNNESILNIKGEDFLTEDDYGKTVSVWLNMNCNAGDELAKGYAYKDAYLKVLECSSNCNGGFLASFFCKRNCQTKHTEFFNQIYTTDLIQKYQSNNSNAISFTYLRSAPTITSILPTDAKCYDGQDSSLKIQFGSSLNDNEKLNIILTNKDKGDEITNYNDIVLEPDNSYIISNLAGGNYTLQLNGFYLSAPLYSSTIQNPLTFEIKKMPPVDFKIISSKNVNCHNGSDGIINLNASGGVGNYEYTIDDGNIWNSFTNTTDHIIDGLLFGNYSIKIRDENKCIAKVQKLVNGNIELGIENVLTQAISQPDAPLSINYSFKKDPTFYGAANGKLVASIIGGTSKDDNSYNYEWKNSSGVTLSTTAQYNSADKTYNITLDNVPDNTYKLTVKDKNYEIAVNKEGCSIIESTEILTQPNPIEISLSVTQSISCNSANLGLIENEDKASDGILKAIVTGGVPFTGSANAGLPYQYIWSKYNDETKAWDILKDFNTDEAPNLSQGKYSLNVIDANGITQGTYSTSALETAIPTEKSIFEPTALQLTKNSGNVSCYQGNNGWANVIEINDEPAYKYTWHYPDNTVKEAKALSELVVGNYSIDVISTKGCFITDNIQITEPSSELKLKYLETTPPTFFGATNGRIVAEVSGGTIRDDNSYGHLWKNGNGDTQPASTVFDATTKVYTIILDNLPAGDYYLAVWDKNYDATKTAQIVNCSVLDSKKTLTDPAPLKVVFEIKKTISCNTTNEFGNAKDTEPSDGQRDESQDGILIAHVTGGVSLLATENNGLPYYFYWKKQQTDGSWQNLTSIKDSIAKNLSQGNYALNIKDRNGIVLGTYVNNQLVTEIDVKQLMQEPPKLEVAITKGDVFCNGGNDGWATAMVTGGTLDYKYKWSNEQSFTEKENLFLKTGTYSVYITDNKGCIAEANIKIDEPKNPLTINYSEVLNPSFYKANNGKIVAEISGGTIEADNSYWYEWKNSKGIIQANTTSKFNNGIFEITLNGVPDETYFLTVHDANYSKATNKLSCSISESRITLEEPEPIVVSFEVVRSISCNVSNEFGNETDNNPLDGQRDESQNGILKANVTGGIQLEANKNNGLPYYYSWKKQQKDGSWILWNDQDETAENLSDGVYALNVEDANGIKLGTYVNNILDKEIDVTQDMPEPQKLNITFTKFDVGCETADDGWAEAHITGGIQPYSYEWSNEEITPKIENITTNNYFVLVKDQNSCLVQGSIFVGDPNGILTESTTKNPTCFEGNDGEIKLDVSGGNLPYSYLWNTGAKTKDLTNIPAGNYDVTISCPDCCLYKKKFTLINPEPIVVSLGADRTLCNDQFLDLDATIQDDKAQYLWTSTNGFSANEAKVSLTKSGTYNVKVTSNLGCVGEDEIIIKTTQAVISSEFLLSSQAYLDEEVILVNTSDPFGENTEWIIPEGVKIVEQKEKFITLQFDAIGSYTIGLLQTQGDCYATYNKNITIEKRTGMPNTDDTSKFITGFVVTPNPSDGNFIASISLENSSSINLRLFSATGQFSAIQKKDSGKKKYEVDFETSLAAGIYVLVLETEQQTLIKKIIIY